MGTIWTLLIGALIGAIGGKLTSQGQSMGWIANIFAGLVGSWVGEKVLGSWGPHLAGMALIPSVIGAVVVVIVVGYFFGKQN